MIGSKESVTVLLLISFFCSPIFAPGTAALADLTITPDDILFSNEHPAEEENVTINATIRNLGDENATGTVIRFLDDGVPITNVTIDVPSFSNASAIVNWTAQIGPTNMTVLVDPESYISESDETNNDASRNISVSAYHIFFGDATSILAIGADHSILYAFDGISSAGIANILVADSDSNVDFNSLQAIGRRKFLGNAFDDFRDVDTLLGMQDFNDSISNLYTFFGIIPRDIDPFVVFNSTIRRVPVVPSTNSSAFRTGILWDASDDTGGFFGQYDVSDQEDLVFITKVNTQQGGAFGIYDYEIKVPALLRSYEGSGSTVTFFLELS